MEVFQEFISLLIFDYLKVLINELKKIQFSLELMPGMMGFKSQI